jgi:hypothetical protein
MPHYSFAALINGVVYASTRAEALELFEAKLKIATEIERFRYSIISRSHREIAKTMDTSPFTKGPA